MSKTAKNTTAVTRRHEYFVMRRRFRFQLFCEQCGGDEEFVSLDDAVLFSGLATRELVQMTNEDKLHFLETSGGHLFICQKSLSANKLAALAEDDAFYTIETNTHLLGEKK